MGKALTWADSASHNEPKLLYGRYRCSMFTTSCPTRPDPSPP